MARQGQRPYIAMMEPTGIFLDIWQSGTALIEAVPRSGLLVATVAAVLAGWIGSVMVRRHIPLGGLIRFCSTIALVGILITVVLQLSRFDPRMAFSMEGVGLPDQVVEGGETRIPLAPDGHFWLQADVNGAPVDFMIDTGATLTAISMPAAQRAGLTPRTGGLPVRLNTANGTIAAELTTIDELRFGNVAARGLDAVMAPNLGDTNVIGMNLLSRLKGWRVEDSTLILTPNNPQPVLERDDRE